MVRKAVAAGAENGEKSAVGRPSGRIWRIQGTPINTGPGGEAFVDVRAAESARNVLNGPYGGKNRPFWPFFDYFLQKRVASLTGYTGKQKFHQQKKSRARAILHIAAPGCGVWKAGPSDAADNWR